MVNKLSLITLLPMMGLLLACGCKGKKSDISEKTSDPAQVKALQESLSSGMTDIGFTKLSQAHVGKQCVITVSTPKERTPTPPPMGTMQILGDVSLYRAELESVGSDGVKLRARRASGNYWSVEIPEEQIISIAMAR